MASDYEDNGEFYDSLDQIVSSSGSSTSVSDSESDTPRWRASLDVWIVEPLSIEDSRRRLLHRMGLVGDPSLSCQKSPVHPPQTGRSVSCNDIPPPSPANSSAVVRSTSDNGSVDRTVAVDEEEIARRRCTIRNLDTGKEFEVNEDEQWEKVREVGTGHQLSMDEFEITVSRSPIVQELMRRQKEEESVASPVAAAVGNGVSKKRGTTGRIKHVARIKHRDCGEEGRRSATDDSQDALQAPERTRVHQCGKMNKELNDSGFGIGIVTLVVMFGEWVMWR